jgi:hypothetical protein
VSGQEGFRLQCRRLECGFNAVGSPCSGGLRRRAVGWRQASRLWWLPVHLKGEERVASWAYWAKSPDGLAPCWACSVRREGREKVGCTNHFGRNEEVMENCFLNFGS